MAESFKFVVRFEQDGFSVRKNYDLPVDGRKVRVRAGATVAPGESCILAKRLSYTFV